MRAERRTHQPATLLRLLAVVVLAFSFSIAAHAEQSLGEKLKRALKAPTPTPTPHRKKKKKTSAESSGDEKKPSPSPSAEENDSPKPKPKASPASDSAETAKKKTANGASPSKRRQKGEGTPTPSPTATPSPKPAESPSPSASPEKSASPTPTPPAVAPPDEKKKGAPATVPPGDIAEYEKYPPGLRKMTDLGLDLAGRNLQYKYGSADPAQGGMDCSGFVHYVLSQTGVHDVPRDSSELYTWARKAGTFRAVNSQKDDTFELDELKPGDLLFWTGTYSIERDPPITHTMIYLGREKKTGHRIMVGASDGRTYQGESRFGVSVFDFKVAHPPRDKDAKRTPTFIGYARVPGLNVE